MNAEQEAAWKAFVASPELRNDPASRLAMSDLLVETGTYDEDDEDLVLLRDLARVIAIDENDWILDATEFVEAGFTPVEAEEWVLVGVRKPEAAEFWRDFGYSARDWWNDREARRVDEEALLSGDPLQDRVFLALIIERQAETGEYHPEWPVQCDCIRGGCDEPAVKFDEGGEPICFSCEEHQVWHDGDCIGCGCCDPTENIEPCMMLGGNRGWTETEEFLETCRCSDCRVKRREEDEW